MFDVERSKLDVQNRYREKLEQGRFWGRLTAAPELYVQRRVKMKKEKKKLIYPRQIATMLISIFLGSILFFYIIYSKFGEISAVYIVTGVIAFLLSISIALFIVYWGNRNE